VLLAASAAAVVTSVPYLLVQLGRSTPVPLPVVDAAHGGSGVVVGWYLVAKVWRAGFRLPVPGVHGLASWQRWLSCTLGLTVAGVLGSGAAALTPLSPPVRDDLVQVHLMLTVWAAVLVLLHVWGHRRRLQAADGERRARWFVPVSVVVAVPVVLGAALPAAVSLPARMAADARWSASGPRVFTDVLAHDGPDGLLVAGGAGLFVRPVHPRGGDGTWRRVGPFDGRRIVLGVLVAPQAARSTDGVFVGAADGLYGAPTAVGPYRRLTTIVTAVHGVALDAAGRLWCAGTGGVARRDAGAFHIENAGLRRPDTAWALTSWRGALYVSDATGVYRWEGARWRSVQGAPDVVALDVTGDGLTASSMGAGITTTTGARWYPADAGIVRHDHGPAHGVHVVSVTAVSASLDVAGTMTAGAAVSTDGRTWMPVWPQLGRQGVVWRVLAAGDDLVAATDHGVLATPRPGRRAPPAWWWPVAAAVSLAGGGAGVAALWPRRGRRVAR